MQLDKIIKKVNEKFPNILVTEQNGGVRLAGELNSTDEIVQAGRLAVDKKQSRGVINNITLKGFVEKPMRVPSVSDKTLNGLTPDVLIIGGGIVGAAILRELSRFNLDTLLIEKEYDLATAQSSRNDGMIHAGIDLKPTSKKLHYNMRGNKLYNTLSKELDVPINKVGQYVLYISPWQKLIYPLIYLRSKQNKTPIKRVSKSYINKKISNSGFNYGGIFCSAAGIVCPYGMTLALAENAVLNGAKISLNTAALEIENDGKRVISVTTNRGAVYPKVLINAAGVFSDKIAQMAGDRFFTIHPRRGTEAILDKKAITLTDAVVGRFVLKSHTKGGGVVRTIDNNILVGPTAVETQERENEATYREELNELFKKHGELLPSLKQSDVITYFAGTRATNYEEEFVVEKSPVIENLVQAAAIQSPGITAAPAIGQDIARFAVEILGKEAPVQKNNNFNPLRKGIVKVSELSDDEREKLIEKDPRYGIIICRCEEISLGEIIDAVKSPVASPTIDGIKRRVRAGMGRCQGGFCAPLITKIIAEELGIDILDVEKKGEGVILFGRTK
jgi:glycerol-3-phosphate dehydrogenase